MLKIYFLWKFINSLYWKILTFTNLVVSCQIEILALLQGVLFRTNEPTYSVTSNCLSLHGVLFWTNEPTYSVTSNCLSLQGVLFWTNEPTYSVTSNCLSLKNQRFTPSGYKGIGNKSLSLRQRLNFFFGNSPLQIKNRLNVSLLFLKKGIWKKHLLRQRAVQSATELKPCNVKIQ